LEGEIVDVTTIKNERKTSNALGWFASCLMIPFQPAMALMVALGIITRPKEYIEYTNYRVLCDDGRKREARLERDIKRGSINMGDLVQFWGPTKDNVVIIQQGFNHETATEIVLGK